MEYLYALAILFLSGLCYAVKGGQHRPVRIFLMRLAGATVDSSANFIEGAEVAARHRILNRILDGKTLSTVMYSALVFALVYLTGRNLPIFEYFGLAIGFFTLLAAVLLAAVGWLSGVAPSMGEEVGGTGGYKGAWGQYVDAVRPDGRKAFKEGYGAAKCLQRGTWMGACLALVTGSLWFIPAGMLMPVTAWLGISWEQKAKDATRHNPQVSWWRHEWIMGIACPGIPLVILFIV